MQNVKAFNLHAELLILHNLYFIACICMLSTFKQQAERFPKDKQCIFGNKQAMLDCRGGMPWESGAMQGGWYMGSTAR